MLKLGFSCNGIQRFYFFLPGFRRFSTSSLKEGNTSSSLSSSSSSLAHYLVNNLGFSNHQSHSTSATLVCRRMSGANLVNDFNWVEKAESVIQFLEQIGFQQSDIKKVVCYEPRILISRVNQTLKPKFKLLNDLGLSGSDLVQTIVNHPFILRQRLGPAIHAFRTVLGSDEKVARVMKQLYGVKLCDAAKNLIPNVELFQSYCGISDDKLHKHIFQKPAIYCMKTNSFRNLLVRVEEKLGIPRNSVMFVYGIQCAAICSDKNIYRKCELFKSFGWTQSHVMEFIKRNPLCLAFKEEKIKDKLEFLMNRLGYKPDYLASRSSFFNYSTARRILPRHRVLQVLKEKGLIKKHHVLYSACVQSEAKFLKRFVFPYEVVHKIYSQLTGSTVKSLVAGTVKGQI